MLNEAVTKKHYTEPCYKSCAKHHQTLSKTQPKNKIKTSKAVRPRTVGTVPGRARGRRLLPATYRPLLPSWDSKRLRQWTWGWRARRSFRRRRVKRRSWRARTPAAPRRKWWGARAGSASPATCPATSPAARPAAPTASWPRRRLATPFVQDAALNQLPGREASGRDGAMRTEWKPEVVRYFEFEHQTLETVTAWSHFFLHSLLENTYLCCSCYLVSCMCMTHTVFFSYFIKMMNCLNVWTMIK